MKTQEVELSKFSKNMFIFDFQINHFHRFMFLNTL